jgi:hypothetical protein
MVADELIVELHTEHGPDGPDSASDERRRTYALTPFGRRVAEAEAGRLAALVDAAERRGLLPGRPSRGRKVARPSERGGRT